MSNDTATTKIYTLSLHDALPILEVLVLESPRGPGVLDHALLDPGGAAVRRARDDHRVLGRADAAADQHVVEEDLVVDRKSTRLNSSHSQISYAVFCSKKKTNVKT